METSPNEVFEEFTSFGVSQLKDFLSIRGLNSSGTKSQLVSRCFVAWENKVSPKLTHYELENKLKKEYDSRLEQFSLQDPVTIDPTSWSNDIINLPKIDIGKIFTFILSTKDHDIDYIGHYKTHKSYPYFVSGFKDTIFVAVLNNITYIKSMVIPSQSIRNEPHNVWIALDSSCNILTSWCSCIAGMAQTCNHVISILYKIEYANTMGYVDPSCTSVPCGWNSRTKKIEAIKVCNLHVRQDDRRKVSGAASERKGLNMDTRCKFDPRKEYQRAVNEQDLSKLFSNLFSLKPNAVLFTEFPKNKENEPQLLASWETILTEHLLSGGDINSISFTSEQVRFLEENTRGQCNLWHVQRKGRLTASIHHEISVKFDLATKGKKNINISSIICKILGKSRSISNLPPVKYGLQNEKNGLSYLYSVQSALHKNFKLYECGLFIKSDIPFLAGTPDGIATCDCCGKQTVEIKCPFVLSGMSVSDGWSKTDFLENASDGIQLKKCHKYYSQVQSQMAVVGVDKSFFVIWSPKGSLITTVPFDLQFYLLLQEKLCQFYKIYVVPYLVGTKQLSICPECESVCLSEYEFSDPDQNSILCEVCDLWYHWKCVALKGPCTGAWICKNCLEADVAKDL